MPPPPPLLRSVASLLGDLRELVNNAASFPDVTFIVEGEPVYAHRSVLTARSAHFRAMFTSGMKESRELVVPYAEWSRAAFLAMLEFLYTGSTREVSVPVALELLGLADHIGLEGLRALSEALLVHRVDAHNVCTLVAHAHRHSASELKRFCLEYILKHSETIALDPLADTPALLIEITRLVLARNKA